MIDTLKDSALGVKISPREISRRQLLTSAFGLTLAGCGLGTQETQQPIPTPDVVIAHQVQNELGRKIESLENQFNIKLVTIQDILTSRPDLLIKMGKSSPQNVSWNNNYLDLLNNVLSNLPVHFYSPDTNGKVNFSLSNFSAFKAENGSFIFLSTKSFDPNKKSVDRKEQPNLPIEITAHELTHKVSENKLPELFAKVDTILGGAFINKRSDLITETKSPKYGNYVNSEEQLAIMDEWIFHFEYGLMFGDPYEFIASLGAIYLYGRQNFEKGAKIYLPQSGIDLGPKLYRFMRDEIYLGKEYEGIPQV